MKTHFHLFMLLALFFLPTAVLAQLDERAPGIYAVVGEESLPLPFVRSITVGFGDFVSYSTVYYKGESSGLNASRTFVLVTDLTKSTFTIKDPFVSTLRPVNAKLLPLLSNKKKHRREYKVGVRIAAGLLYEDEYGLEFDWEQITDNSYLITVPENLPAGEYGFAFCVQRFNEQDFFNAIFGFTIPEK